MDRKGLILRSLEFWRDEVMALQEPGPIVVEQDATYRRIAEFVHAIAQVPELREHLIFLIERNYRLAESADVKAKQSAIADGIAEIAGTLLTGIDETRETPLWSELAPRIERKVPVMFSDPRMPVPIVEQLLALRDRKIELFDRVGRTRNASSALGFVRTVLDDIHGLSALYELEADEVLKPSEGIEIVIEQLRSRFEFEAWPEGAESARELVGLYVHVNPAAGQSLGMLAMILAAVHHGGAWPERSVAFYKPHVRLLAEVMSRRLLELGAADEVVARLALFCEAFESAYLLEVVAEAGAGKQEATLHAFLDEFLFREGYFPLTEVRVGDARMDTLAIRATRVSLERSVPVGDLLLIEVKQQIDGTPITNRHFGAFVNQSVEYARRIEAIRGELPSTVYLIIFHRGPNRYHADDVEIGVRRVRPVFVNLEDPSPSKSAVVVLAPAV